MLADFTALLLALGTIMSAGYGAMRWLGDGAGISWPERAGLSWLLGTGLVSLALWLLGMVVRGPVLIGTVAASAVAVLVTSRNARFVPTRREPLSLIDWVLVGVLLGQVVFLVWWTPHTVLGSDGLLIWETKARIAFQNGGALPIAYFSDASRVWSQPQNPLMLPGVETWLYLCLGHIDEAWVRLIGPLFYLAAMGVLVGAACRLDGSRTAGLALASAMFFVPCLFVGTQGLLAGSADFPLGVLWLATVSWIFALPDGPHAERLIAVLGALLLWMKRDGLFPWLALLLITFVWLWRAKRLRRWTLIAAPGIVLGVGFTIFLAVAKAPGDPNSLAPTPDNLIAQSDRIIPVTAAIADEMGNFGSWSLLWPGTLLALGVIMLRERSRGVILATALLIPLAGFALAFVLSQWKDLSGHLDVALPRLLLQLVPTALLIVALAIPRLPQFSLAKPTPEPESPTPAPCP